MCIHILTPSAPLGLTGSVSPVYATGMSLSRAGVVAGLDMTTEGALTKLAYLLALPDSSPETVTKYMSISLRGELTESSMPVFRHPDGPLPERVQTLTAMAYAIAHGDLERVQDIMKIEHHWLLNDEDYSGNTPIVSLNFRNTRRYHDNCQGNNPMLISSSMLHRRHLPSQSFTSCCRKAGRSIYGIAPDVPRCSWPPTQDSRSMYYFCASPVRTCIRMSDRRQNY